VRHLLRRVNGGLKPSESRCHCGNGFGFEWHGGAPSVGVQARLEAVACNDWLALMLPRCDVAGEKLKLFEREVVLYPPLLIASCTVCG
jgi:hypothetical protein